MKNGPKSSDIDKRAHDPFYWLKQARELDRAAMLIWKSIRNDIERMSQAESKVGSVFNLEEFPFFNLGGVFWLNAGFALENLLKGIIVQSDPASVSNGVISRQLKTHDLFKLATLASLKIDAIDAFFLWVGTQCTVWAGRYPCSTKPGESAPPIFSEADVIAYRRLYERMERRYDLANEKTVRFERLA